MQSDELAKSLAARTKMLARHFKPAYLQQPNATFQFNFDEGADFYLRVSDQEFEFVPGALNKPTLTLYINSHDTCWKLLSGEADGMTAFMDGTYRADGNIVLSQMLLHLFKSDDPAIAYQLQD